MAGGWGGTVMRKETEFYALDGLYVTRDSILFSQS